MLRGTLIFLYALMEVPVYGRSITAESFGKKSVKLAAILKRLECSANDPNATHASSPAHSQVLGRF